MSQEQAKYLLGAARQVIDAAVAQGWALSFPTAAASLYVGGNYLLAASGELGGAPNIAALGNEVAAKGNEIAVIGLIPWPFVYAAIGPWANALGTIKSRIPDVVILEPVRTTAPGVPAPGASAIHSPFQDTAFAGAFPAAVTAVTPGARMPLSSNAGKGPKGYRRSDDRVREDVCDALSVDPLVDASDVEVEVSSGKVVLKGAVASHHVKRRVEDLALAVTGVVDVENTLRLPS